MGNWAFGITGGGVAEGRMVGYASCKPADTLVFMVVVGFTYRGRKFCCGRYFRISVSDVHSKGRGQCANL